MMCTVVAKSFYNQRETSNHRVVAPRRLNLGPGQPRNNTWTTVQWVSKFTFDDVIKCKHFPRYSPFVRGIHRWIPRTKASDAELWCFLWSALDKRLSKQSWGWWFETPSHPLWRHCNAFADSLGQECEFSSGNIVVQTPNYSNKVLCISTVVPRVYVIHINYNAHWVWGKLCH